MIELPQLPPEVFAELPEAVRAHITALEQIIRTLSAQVAELTVRVGKNSSNSSRPPSSDPPHAKPAPPKKPSGKQRGGQPKHPRNDRPLLPPDTVHELRPSVCGDCAASLSGDDPEPLRHQVVELPPPRPQVTEYRRHRLTCPSCGRVTCAELPDHAQRGFGPRLQAACGLLSGAYRLSKRAVSAVCTNLLGIPISPAAVCDLQANTADALKPAFDAAHAYLADKPVNVDETSWRQSPKRGWLWVAVAALVTVFLIRPNRKRGVLTELVGTTPGVITSDRFSVYSHLEGNARQICWAHLRRDFQAMIDRGGGGKEIGQELLNHADVILDEWRQVREGSRTREEFERDDLKLLQEEINRLLKAGAECGCAPTATVCTRLLAIEQSLWTFAKVEGVEPTNNAAERALRHAVCWRKLSHGTNSAGGSRFVERVLTAVESCRQQGRKVLTFLTDTIVAHRQGLPTPSLVPISAPPS